MEKDIVIYSMDIAKSLIKYEYKLKNMETNKKVKNRIVFYFEDSEKLREHLKTKHNLIF